MGRLKHENIVGVLCPFCLQVIDPRALKPHAVACRKSSYPFDKAKDEIKADVTAKQAQLETKVIYALKELKIEVFKEIKEESSGLQKLMDGTERLLEQSIKGTEQLLEQRMGFEKEDRQRDIKNLVNRINEVEQAQASDLPPS